MALIPKKNDNFLPFPSTKTLPPNVLLKILHKMILPKSPYLWLSISVTCCAFALGLIPTIMPDALLAEVPTSLPEPLYTTPMPVATPVRSYFVVNLVEEEYTGDVIIPVDGLTTPDRDVFKIVEQMPLFPGKGCGDIEPYKDRRKCAINGMLEYLYGNIKYPKEAKDLGVEGMAVVSFIIEPHGAITNIEIVRDPGAGLGQTAAGVVKKMRSDNLRWEPGLQKGKPVPVQYMLPVKFEL